MYERFYGLKERPFDLSPNPRFLCFTPQHREALAHLEYGLGGRPGLTVLLGEAGTGKTTLVRKALQGSTASTIAHLSNPTLTRAEFFEYLAAGKVIVASDIPTIRDVVGQSEAAYLVAPDSADAIAVAVVAIEREPRRFERMAASARARGMRATWEHKSEELLRWLGSAGVPGCADQPTARESATG